MPYPKITLKSANEMFGRLNIIIEHNELGYYSAAMYDNSDLESSTLSGLVGLIGDYIKFDLEVKKIYDVLNLALEQHEFNNKGKLSYTFLQKNVNGSTVMFDFKIDKESIGILVTNTKSNIWYWRGTEVCSSDFAFVIACRASEF